jgi:hypothetical protein
MPFDLFFLFFFFAITHSLAFDAPALATTVAQQK